MIKYYFFIIAVLGAGLTIWDYVQKKKKKK